MRFTVSLLVSLTMFIEYSNAQDAPSTYVLSTGETASERLDLQGDFMFPKSKDHLSRAGLKEGQIVYDVGCGNGTMTEYIASVVGPSGHVYAVDASAEQLSKAKERIEKAHLNNVSFIQSDLEIDDLDISEQADIIYMRVVLMHLKEPSKALVKLFHLLRSGGRLAVQESMTRKCVVVGDENYLSRFIFGMQKIGEHLGVDYNIGLRIAALARDSGFIDIEQEDHDFVLDPESARKFLTLSLTEWGKRAVAAQVFTQDDYESLLVDISNLQKPFKLSGGGYLVARKK